MGTIGSSPKCLMSQVQNGTPPHYFQVLRAHPTLMLWHHLGRSGLPLPSLLWGLASPHPIMPEQPEAWYFGAARSWHSALVVPPLPGECVGRLQLHSCLARGKERREMSRWIYLEPDLPPTASEEASGRARSQARERKVGEGDPGTREGWGASDGLAGWPPTPSICQYSPCNSSCLLTRDGKNLLGPSSPAGRLVLKLTLAPWAMPAVPSTVSKRCPPEP